MKIKKVLFFCGGDPRSASSWSNVPCCFVQALERRGIEVVTVRTSNEPLTEYVWDYLLRRVLNVLLCTDMRYYQRTRLSKWFSERVIRKAVRRNADADLCVFIGYQYYNKWSGAPSLLFSDWSNEMAFERSGSKPSYFERRNLRQERAAINGAEYVVSMFPVCASRMRQLYPEARIFYPGGNVINNLYGQEPDEECTIGRKERSRSILFIGKPDRYKDSAIKVIAAYEQLRRDDPALTLDIIGMRKEHLPQLPEGVTCHGFLHKDNPQECRKYYELMTGARVIVNPTPKWAAYSSIVEAMYFYTPVVVSPYADFKSEFGERIDFGRYNDNYSAAGIAEDIRQVAGSNEYLAMCRSAHDHVKEYTWDKYVEKILNIIDDPAS